MVSNDYEIDDRVEKSAHVIHIQSQLQRKMCFNDLIFKVFQWKIPYFNVKDDKIKAQ